MEEVAVSNGGTKTFTCDRCTVAVSWMDGHEQAIDLPANWAQEGELLLCLGCRRDVAAESAPVPEETPPSEAVKLKSQARIEFEVQRVPENSNGEVARACRSSAAAVQKARVRLGLTD